MRSIHSLAKQLQNDFPQFQFDQSETFAWSPSTATIHWQSNEADSAAFLLHEVSHALLGHAEYRRDIELIKHERDAWSYAIDQLASRYNTVITDELVQSTLDTYRDWLHSRSTCPHCETTGLQIKKHLYQCLACSQEWKVNEARLCALRRYPIKKIHR